MTELQQFEITIEECQAKVRLAEQLEKLIKNRAFKEVIEKGFMEQELLKKAPLVGHPNEVAATGARNACIGAGALQVYLNSVLQEGAHAKAALEELEAAKLEIVTEE